MSDDPQTPAPGAVPPVPSAYPGHGAPPVYTAPASAAVPHGYAYPQPAYGAPAPYAHPTSPTPPARPVASTLGVTALLVAIAGVLISTVVAVITGATTGPMVLAALETPGPDGSIDLGYLSPVRGWVLAGEIAFWTGTALGIWAIVQGGVALASRRGFGAGLAAIIVAAVGPVVFFVALTLALGVGAGIAAA